jgi:aspartate ammonia-lyase
MAERLVRRPFEGEFSDVTHITISFAAEAGQLQLNAFEPSSPIACSRASAICEKLC